MNAVTNPRTERSAIIGGLVLVLIGGAALVSQLWPEYDRYLPLAIGVVFMVAFAITRNYAALVGGSILTGLGIGVIAATALPDDSAGGASVVLGLGMGFLAIWTISRVMNLPHHHAWPLVPGFILTVIGVALAVDAFATDTGRLIAPTIVLVIGLAIMAGGVLASRKQDVGTP